MEKVAIIGGGPAGIFAAIAVSELGVQPVLFEKNRRLGVKLNITGKGRCNITNDAELDGLIEAFGENGRFLYSAFHAYSNQRLLAFLESLGVKTKTERGGRVFPQSDRAGDVVNALISYLAKQGVEVCLGADVKDVLIEEGHVRGLTLADKTRPFAAVVVATGGLSYPKTGSSGDGYHFAKRAGHRITALTPSLVPLKTKEAWPKSLQGLALKNVSVTVYAEGEKLDEAFGEMLFTHMGVSGPIILTVSRAVVKGIKRKKQGIRLELNLKPALSVQQLDARLQRVFQENANKQFKNGLDSLFPKKLIPVMVELSGILPEKTINQISREERVNFAGLIQKLPLTIVGDTGYDEAIITAGGVALKEITASTMASKKVEGLYFAGEVLDIDAQTGGYNLQAAFSTGYLAGKSAAQYVLKGGHHR